MEEMNKINEGVLDFLRSAESVMNDVCDEHFEEEKKYIDFEYNIKSEIVRLEKFLIQAENHYKNKIESIRKEGSKEIKEEREEKIRELWEIKKEKIISREKELRNELKNRLLVYTKKMSILNNKAELLAGNNTNRKKAWNIRTASDRVKLDAYEMEKKRDLNKLIRELNLEKLTREDELLRSVIDEMDMEIERSATFIKPKNPSFPVPDQPKENGVEIETFDIDDGDIPLTEEEELPRGPKKNQSDPKSTGRSENDLVVAYITPDIYVSAIPWRGQAYNYLYFQKGTTPNHEKDLVIFVLNMYGVNVPFYLDERQQSVWPFLGFNERGRKLPDYFFLTKKDDREEYRENFYTYYTSIDPDSPRSGEKKIAEVKITKDISKNYSALSDVKKDFEKIRSWFKEKRKYYISYETSFSEEVTEEHKRNTKYYSEGHHKYVFYEICSSVDDAEREIKLYLKELIDNILIQSKISESTRSLSKYNELINSKTNKSDALKNLTVVMRGIYTAISLKAGFIKKSDLEKSPVLQESFSGKYQKKTKEKMIKNFEEFFKEPIQEGLAEIIGTNIRKGIDKLVGTPKGKVDQLLKKIQIGLNEYTKKYFNAVTELIEREEAWKNSSYSSIEEDALEEANQNLRDIQKSYFTILDGLKGEAISVIGNNQNLLNYFNQELEILKQITRMKIDPQEQRIRSLRREIERINTQRLSSVSSGIPKEIGYYITMGMSEFKNIVNNKITRSEASKILDGLEKAKESLEALGEKRGSEKISKIQDKIKILDGTFRLGYSSYGYSRRYSY